MYAIIVIKNQQFMVTKGSVVTLQGKLGEVGEAIHADKVLFHSKNGVLINGTPSVEVATKITSIARSKKVSVKTYKRRKRYHKQYGSRHYLTSLKVTAISVASGQ